jgi:hypothetical protein
LVESNYYEHSELLLKWFVLFGLKWRLEYYSTIGKEIGSLDQSQLSSQMVHVFSECYRGVGDEINRLLYIGDCLVFTPKSDKWRLVFAHLDKLKSSKRYDHLMASVEDYSVALSSDFVFELSIMQYGNDGKMA